jgi:hypothetical protein
MFSVMWKEPVLRQMPLRAVNSNQASSSSRGLAGQREGRTVVKRLTASLGLK